MLAIGEEALPSRDVVVFHCLHISTLNASISTLVMEVLTWEWYSRDINKA